MLEMFQIQSLSEDDVFTDGHGNTTDILSSTNGFQTFKGVKYFLLHLKTTPYCKFQASIQVFRLELHYLFTGEPQLHVNEGHKAISDINKPLSNILKRASNIVNL